MGPKEDCCIGPIPFWWFFTPFYATCLLKFWFFRNCLLWRLETCTIGFGTPWTLNMHHSSHFDTFFPVKIKKCESFCCLLDSPWPKMKKVNLDREKVFRKACISAHIGFWVCWLQCTILELCVTSTVLSSDGFFPWFLTGKSRYRVQKHGVWVEWDPRRTAA